MNETVNNLLLAGDKFMPEMRLKQSGFTCSVCEPFTKNKERIKKSTETWNSRYIYQHIHDIFIVLSKIFTIDYFQHDMAYGDFKDFPKRTAFDKVLRDKAFNIAENPKHDWYQRGLASMVYKFCDNKTSGGAVKNENISNQKLAEELHKAIIRKSEKRKVCSSFIYNIWGADLADMQLISKLKK